MKKYLLTYLFIIIFSLALVYTVFKVEYHIQKELFEKESFFILKEQNIKIAQNLESVTSDISYLSQKQNILSSFSTFLAPSDSAELLDFVQSHSAYEQLRTIDLEGKERFRINRLANVPKVVQKSNLQSKKSRYYVTKALTLNRGEFYISALDLNIENKKVERPYRPTLRIATPVFDREGEKRGVIVLNVNYGAFLNYLQSSLKKDEIELFIANHKGAWIIAPKKEDSWRFMFGEVQNQLKEFSPKLWEQISTQRGDIIDSKQYLCNYKVIRPLELIEQNFSFKDKTSTTFNQGLDENLQWYFVVAISNKVLTQRTLTNVYKGLPYLFLGVLILFILSTYLIYLIEKMLLQTKELKLAASYFLNSDNGMVITDTSTKILQVNPRYEEITGYRKDELMGRMINMLSSGLTSKKTYQKMWESIETTGKWEGELSDRKKDGSAYIQLLRIYAIKDERGKVENYLGITTDITEKRESDQKIHKLAFEDIVTGLPNRKYFENELIKTIASSKQNRRSIAVIFIDLDNFKWINVTAGHLIGDHFLREVAKRLDNSLSLEHLMARFSGDKFFIIIDFANYHLVPLLAKQLLQSLQQPIKVNEDEFFTTASMGIAFYPQDASTAQKLIQHANTAMYQAKADGKNRYRFFASTMNKEVNREFSLESHLNHAIKNNEFQLLFQPQISLKTKEVVGAEALIRWKSAELGDVYPNEFIPVAELSDKIIPITMWVIKESCKMLKKIQRYKKDISLAVNISSRHIKNNNFTRDIYEAVSSEGILAKQIELEITEGSLIENIEETIEKINTLKSYGFRIAIDDFGTGYSSLSYLKKFGFHKLKIDRAFVYNLPHDKENNSLTKAIITISKTFNMKVIAEGAETKEHIAFLEENKCDMVQGYYFSKPLSSKDFIAYLKNFKYE